MKRIDHSINTLLDGNTSKRKRIEPDTNDGNSTTVAVNDLAPCLTTTDIDWLLDGLFEQKTAPSKNDSNLFTTAAFLHLETEVYGDDWNIPFKREEELGQCLLSATKTALVGTADKDECYERFIEVLIPEAFRKLHWSHYVNTWSDKVQLGILEMTELLIDLIAARLSYRPVPVQLLETLGILFDPNSVFQTKNKNQPFERSFDIEELNDCRLFSPSLLSTSSSDTYGWLCQIINRFVLKDGIKNLKAQFQNHQSLTALEFNALLAPFVNCMDYIIKGKYRLLFAKEIDQIFTYIENMNENDFQTKSINNTFELLSTLRKLYSAIWPYCFKRLENLHLNLILKMITQTNINSKMNSLTELAKIIENSTPIPHDVLTEYIMENSILSKALEGNINQTEYRDKVCILVRFIAPYFIKDDVEKLWKMQYRQSHLIVDLFIPLIFAAAVKFNSEQLNHLIDCVYESWKTQTMPMHENSILLLGEIGRTREKESAARILEILWDMTFTNGLSSSMLNCLLRSHYKILSENRPECEEFRRDYSLKCIGLIQRKEGWHARSVKYLNEILHLNPTNNQNLIKDLVNKYDIISVLIESLSNIQQDMWNKMQSNVTADTLVDGHLTFQESTNNHLEPLSFMLKQANLYLILKRAEELWDTLITNKRANTWDREHGFSWFIDCMEDFSYETQFALFKQRVSKLNPIYLCPKGNACFKLYSKKWSRLGNVSTSSIQPIINRDLNALVRVCQGNLTADQSDVIVVCPFSKTLRNSVFNIGGDLIKTFATELKKAPAAPIITIAASGQLAAKTVYILPWKPNTDAIKCCESIRKFVSNAMEKAASDKYQSIAFPAIGCGGYRCSISLVAWTIVDEVYRQLVNYPMSVSFVILPDRMDIYDEFQKQMNLVQQTTEIKSLLVSIGNGSVEVQMGDITAQKVDVIIGNSSSDILKKEIMNAAGTDVEIAYENEYEKNPNSLLVSVPSAFGTSLDHQLPPTWEKSAENKLRFVVPSDSAEYKSIIADFDQTMKRKYTTIIQIERIQNERWYIQYVAHSREFIQRLNIDTEKSLYHGCSQPVADLIIEDCFNRSFAGTHGTAYGVGVYFSSHAAYSHRFTYANSNAERCMFVARVLIGKTTQGNSSVKSRPAGFDSTTDGTHIFVIYHDAQAFAEYLITYK
ncbi:hypothetical protein I4U23_005079 [Adineta vaga]|nr:hypothetical protein I4U23_005079 [Adineta vaga]